MPHFLMFYCTLGWMVGLSLQFVWSNHFPYFLFALPILALIMVLRVRDHNWGCFLVFFLFAALGTGWMQEKMSLPHLERWEENYLPGRIYEARVVEANYTDKEWKKVILQTRFVFNSNKAIPVKMKILAFVKSNKQLLNVGDVIRLPSEVRNLTKSVNPGAFNVQLYWSSKAIFKMAFVQDEEWVWMGNEQSAWERWSMGIRSRLSDVFDRHLEADARGLSKALFLGDKKNLDQEVLQHFSNAGAMHILAVSGLHVGIILHILLWCLGRFPRWISKYQALFFALGLLILYCVATGFPASVCRAVLMFGLLAVGKVYGRNSKPINLLFASAFILLVFNPFFLLDMGFQLSYLAMLGIFLLYKPLERLVYFRWKPLRNLWQATVLGLSATLLTAPLTLFYFHQFPNYFVLSNLLLLFITPIMLFLAILLLVLHVIPGVVAVLGSLLNWGAWWMVKSVEWIDGLPGAVAYGFDLTIAETALMFMIILLVCYFWEMRKSFAFVIILATVYLFIPQRSRWERLASSHWAVLSTNQPLLVYKIRNEIWAFAFKQDEKTKRILDDYCKVYPGQLKFHELKEGWSYQPSNRFPWKVKVNKEGVECFSNNEKWWIPKYFSSKTAHLNARCLVFPHLPQTKGSFSLKEKIWIKKLS